MGKEEDRLLLLTQVVGLIGRSCGLTIVGERKKSFEVEIRKVRCRVGSRRKYT